VRSLLKEINKFFFFVSHCLHCLFIHNLDIERVDIVPDLIVIIIVVVTLFFNRVRRNGGGGGGGGGDDGILWITQDVKVAGW